MLNDIGSGTKGEKFTALRKGTADEGVGGGMSKETEG